MIWVGIWFGSAYAAGCTTTPPPPKSPRTDAQAPPAHDVRPRAESPLATSLDEILDPWSWERARGATERERAIENIGPYHHDSIQTPDESPASQPATAIRRVQIVNSNAYYWTHLVGIAWRRDVDLHFDDEPVDLDADGKPDTTITRHIHAPGGILANPKLFGLVPTPDDPDGTVGKISASVGYLGLREALTPEGQPSGQIGMTCFLCHGAAHPDSGLPVLGLPAAAFDYGLLLATAAVLDDHDAAATEYRRARRHPSGRIVRARLLMAGPGRQDLTGEFGLDVTIAGIHSARYPGTARVRQGTVGIVNPLSVPGVWGTAGMDLQNWSGSEVASSKWLARLIALGGSPAFATLKALDLVDDQSTSERGASPDGAGSAIDSVPNFAATARMRRALLLDLRNLGTLGLQHDSYPALLWADAIYGRATLSPAQVRAIPRWYAAAPVRRVTEQAASEWAAGALRPNFAIDRLMSSSAARAASVTRGRAVFSDRFVGEIANRQVLKEPPRVYDAARMSGPVLAPLDAALPHIIPVRCADCHNATPGGPWVSLDTSPPPLGRCSHCHRSHSAGRSSSDINSRKPLAALGVPGDAIAEVAHCRQCHDRHRSFSPVAYSSSMLLPFDANANGFAQDDEAADLRDGGIGTEALLAFDVPRPQRPPLGFQVALPSLGDPARLATAPVTTVRLGAGWVRVAPLVAIRATAPYLHNGSVPTLAALLKPVRQRPVAFHLGKTGFRLDTRLPGNRNFGHEFGTRLSPAEKRDLVVFLESL